MTDFISIKTYAHLTDLSERTIRRYIATDEIEFFLDTTKNRTYIPLSELKKNVPIALTADDMKLIIQVDKGDINAQNNLAILFLNHAQSNIALYWLHLSSKQECSDAMQLLGQCYATGNGVTKDNNQAIAWISKAATLGHPIAIKQMQRLCPY